MKPRNVRLRDDLPHGLGQEVDSAGVSPVVMGNNPTDRHASKLIQEWKYGLPDSATNVFEIVLVIMNNPRLKLSSSAVVTQLPARSKHWGLNCDESARLVQLFGKDSALNPHGPPEGYHVKRAKKIIQLLIDDRAIERLAAGSSAERVKYDDVDVVRDRVN